MINQDVRSEIFEILVDREITSSSNTDMNNITLEADSLAKLELVMFIEEKYKIQIPDSDLPSFKTADELVKYVSEKLLNKKALN